MVHEHTLESSFNYIERMGNKRGCKSGDKASYRLDEWLWEYGVVTHDTRSCR